MNKKINCVLLVDDDEGTNFINKLILEKSSFAKRIESVLNGKEAIDFIKNNRNNDKPKEQEVEQILIFLDINMPVMDGWCFLESFRELSNEQKKNITIIMLSASLNPADRLKANNYSEISGFYNKSLSVDTLKDIFSLHFSTSDSRSPI